MTRNRFARPAIGRVSDVSPLCGRAGCGHPRLRHYTTVQGVTGCGANQLWPYTDPETGEHVDASHCGCPGFLAVSTVHRPQPKRF